MTDRPAFPSNPKGAKTGSGFVPDLGAESFIAEGTILAGYTYELSRATRQPLVLNDEWLTVRVRVTTPNDPKAALHHVLKGAGRRLIPEWEFPDA